MPRPRSLTAIVVCSIAISTAEDGSLYFTALSMITETELSGDEATSAIAAAEPAVPGGTVERAETDAEGAAFEVHMTTADGSEVTVKLDSSFNVTETIDGHG